MPKKTFEQLKGETQNNFHKLYYEILSRFHQHDYNLAYSQMSDDLKIIIKNCKTEIENDSKRVCTETSPESKS